MRAARHLVDQLNTLHAATTTTMQNLIAMAGHKALPGLDHGDDEPPSSPSPCSPPPSAAASSARRGMLVRSKGARKDATSAVIPKTIGVSGIMATLKAKDKFKRFRRKHDDDGSSLGLSDDLQRVLAVLRKPSPDWDDTEVRQLTKLLSKFSFAKDLPSALLKKTAESIRVRVVENGQFVVKQGEEGSSFFLILAGTCDV